MSGSLRDNEWRAVECSSTGIDPRQLLIGNALFVGDGGTRGVTIRVLDIMLRQQLSVAESIVAGTVTLLVMIWRNRLDRFSRQDIRALTKSSQSQIRLLRVFSFYYQEISIFTNIAILDLVVSAWSILKTEHCKTLTKCSQSQRRLSLAFSL